MASSRAFARVCVFCGSSPGARPAYAEAADAVAALLVERDLTLVYGGADVGLMRVVADGVLARGGDVTGIIPAFLVDHEIGHGGLTEQHVVADMHERKALMAELSDGFLALPGGFGTLEELFEMVVRTQLRLHDKPVGLLDVDGFYVHLRTFLRHAVAEELVRPANLDLLLFDADPGALLDRMASFAVTHTEGWTGR